jgi:5-methylcytosine-specific restriction endonuclease McrA
VRSRSKKQAVVKGALDRIFKGILLKYDGKCTGCGTIYSLTPSHLIRRSKRPDLILDPRNVKPHCIRCHSTWDTGDVNKMKLLNDFEENMAFIRLVDPCYYNRLMNKLEEKENE